MNKAQLENNDSNNSKPERVCDLSNYAQISIGFHNVDNTHIYNARKEVKN